MAAYARWLAEGAAKYQISIHGWVFMTNHFHLLLTPHTGNSVSLLVQYIGRFYVRNVNDKYTRIGTLFEGRFKSSVVQSSSYVTNCLQYIELNPLRAGIVKDSGDYKWSRYRAQLNEPLSMETMAKVRHCINTGLVLESDTFREQVASIRQ
jgi:putative transposase